MEKGRRLVKLFLGNLCLGFVSELPLTVTEELLPFYTETGEPDVTIYVKEMKETVIMPQKSCGQDLLLDYYQDNRYLYAAARKGTKSSAAVTVYTPDFSEAVMYINEAEFPRMIRRVSKILQLFPVRQLFVRHDAMILHSSRISLGEKSVLFTAPSQNGKSTQARLWKKYENAEIVSNDRTLMQKEGKRFYTYGYPVDGSCPVYNSQKIRLGAIVVLRMGTENHAEQLPVVKAMKYLMEQTVADTWDEEELAALRMLWADLLEYYPVYKLTCTPDQEAVSCLKKLLKKDGVI